MSSKQDNNYDGVKVKYYDPAELAEIKQARRDEDARAIAAGEMSVEEVHEKNGALVHWLLENGELDIMGADALS